LVQLYDLDKDPEERRNLAGEAEHAGRVEQLTQELADHLVRTAREPCLIPSSRDARLLLAHCLKPRDVDIRTYIRNTVVPRGEGRQSVSDQGRTRRCT